MVFTEEEELESGCGEGGLLILLNRSTASLFISYCRACLPYIRTGGLWKWLLSSIVAVEESRGSKFALIRANVESW